MSIRLRRLNSSAIRSHIVCFFALLLLLLLAGEFGQAQAAGITLVQHIGKDAGITTTSTLAFASPTTAGNFVAVTIRGGLSSSQVFTVTDSNGNTYKKAAQIGFTVSAVTGAIYYAENIKGGADTVTVSMTVSGPLRFDILEYSGVATLNSLDATAVATGVGTAANSGNATTTASGDLLLGSVSTADSAIFTAGTGYTIRDFVPAEPGTKLIGEDQIQSTAGIASASATLAASGNWGAILAAFKPVGGIAGTPANITATAGTPQSATVGTSYATQFQAAVKDSFNNPVSGVTVTFSAPGSGASGTFAGGVNTATTNASGVATAAVFTANNTAGAYTVTASVSGVSTPANFLLTNLAGAAASITATAGTPQSATVNTAFATQLQATVRDSLNNPVSGVTVTFTAPGSGASGTFAGGVNTATTNASGIATAAAYSANTTAGGPYIVTASVSGVAGAANFSLTNLAGAAASITATAGTPQSATISTAFAMQLQSTVRDSFNNPVGSLTVTFAAPGSGASGTFAGGVNTATTNASGVATAVVFTANSTAGSYTVTASVSGVASPANFSLTNLAGTAASITATAGTPQSATINTAFATQLQATVKDSGNNPVSGVTVTFTAPGSGASGTFAGGVNTATTDAQGIATAAVLTANSTAGAYTVTASVSGVASPASFSLTNLGNPPASITATAGTPQSATINTAFATQPQATVKDSGNNPVSGVTVTFTAPGSGPSGTFAGGVNTATTNSLGVATAAVFTANSTAGSYTVTASVSGVATPANFSLTNLAGAAASIAATAGTPQNATINTAFTTQLQATVKDSGNNPVSGVTVTFTAPASGASGTFAGGVNTGTTDSLGVATAAVFTANSTAGAYAVTASVSGVATPANFSLTNLAGAASSIAATAGTPQSATVNTAFSTQLQATVTDSFNNPVSGATVTFAAPVSGASGTFAGGVNTATTNAQGVATAPVFTANSVAGGPYTVMASVSGVASPANFSLTNLASVAAPIALVQHRSLDAGTTTTSSLAFASPNTAGNFIAVGIRAGISSSQVFTVSDSNGNTYRQASQIGFIAAGVTMAIYYAENIKAGANTVTVSDTVAGPIRTAILEYSGVATSNSKDVTAAATGTSASPNSGNATTTANGDLLLGAVGTTNGATFTAGPGYKIEELVPVTPNPKLIAEDQIQTSAGVASASAAIAATDTWGAILAAFKAANGGGGSGPTITSLSQTSGAVGVSITITGTNFGATQGTSTVTFNGTVATVSNWSSTSIIVPVPAGATTGPVVVTVGGVPSNGVTFTVVPGPSITSISPTSGPLGTSVTVTGANFGSSQGSSTVTFNGLAGTPTSWSATSIVVPVPNGATSGLVAVTVLGSTSNGINFTVTTPGPSISSLSLTQGPVGAGFSINGANFGSTQGASAATLNGSPLTVTSWSDVLINVTVPSGATTGNVVVTVNSVPSNGMLFTVSPPPNITNINPISGPIGTNVVITGTNFGPTVGTIQSFVTFNGVQTRASNWTNTSITAPVPTGATTGNVLVYVGGVPSNGVTFTVTAAPSITSLNPNFGPVGTSVTINGANFGASQGSSTVTFSGTPATPTSWSASTIVAPVPAGATTGNVIVAVSGVVSNGVNFSVTSSSGNIALIQHRSVDAGSTTSASLSFTSNNTAGNWIAVAVRAGSTTSEVFTITDTNGNTYRQAYQFVTTPSAIVFALYYAENIKGGPNTVSVSDTVSGPLRFAILEYSGVATSNSLDATPATAGGTGSTANSGTLTTGANGDLLLGMVVTPNGDSITAGSGYTIEEAVPGPPSSKLIVEDQIQPAAGSASATASISPSDNWGAGLAAFRSISGVGFPISVTISPTTASVPTGYGTQSFNATITNDFQNKGLTWSLTGAGCSGSTCGTLTTLSNTSVSYTAPGSIPNPATVILTVTSVADNTKSASATITIIQGVLTVVLSPKRAAVTLSPSQTVQFTGTVYNDPSNLGVTYQVDGNNGGNSTTGTITTTGLFTPGTQSGLHTVTAFSNANASVSSSAPVAITDLTGVYTHHNDGARTGQNIQEYALTPSTVSSSTFGQLFSCPVDGYVYAQPLWVAHLNIAGGVHNVVFIATEHDSVYAFDADSSSCIQYWKVSFLGPNVTAISPSDYNGNGDIVPEIGITSTPVIDSSTNTLYVVPKTKETAGTVGGQNCSTASPCFVHRLHALDITTGAEKFGGPVVIAPTNFTPYRHLQRPALLLANNTVYIAFSSHGDQCPYQGWIMGYNASNLAFVFATALTNASPPTNCNRGGVWQAGAGPAVDSAGNIYVETGNGFYDGSTNFSDTAVKLNSTGHIVDWFTPFNQNTFAANDIDLASGGVTILPSSVGSAAHQNLAIATGKVAILYLLDQNNMGRYNCNNTCTNANGDVQEVIPVPPPNTTLLDGGNYGNVAYWNGNIYTTGQNFPLSQFTIANGVVATPQASKSTNVFPPRGAVPVVSANGTTGGVVWIIDYTGWQNGTAAILDAYDATNVGTLLYSSPANGTGSAGPAVKFTVPTVANGKVYVGTQYLFNVYGLRPN